MGGAGGGIQDMYGYYCTKGLAVGEVVDLILRTTSETGDL